MSSTYLNINNPKGNPTYKDAPKLMREYIIYVQSIKNRSPRTVNGYFIDLRTFYRFMLQYRGMVEPSTLLIDIDITTITDDFIKSITKSDIYEFLHFTTITLENKPASRARKASSIKGFYRYLTINGYITENPAHNIEIPNNKKRLPKYLSLEESMELLQTVVSDFPERDYCIFTLFLNCGMRLSELVGINLINYSDMTIKITGKGDKERLVYLNSACVHSIQRYLLKRAELLKINDLDAMFISKRTGRRLTPRRVQQIVSAGLSAAGLSDKGYSTHKLRHTAATLMYRTGNVDILALKEILGHEHVSTTEIYTHISNDQLQKAVEFSPLANFDVKK